MELINILNAFILEKSWGIVQTGNPWRQNQAQNPRNNKQMSSRIKISGAFGEISDMGIKCLSV
jgi:hypothetical protein